MSGSLAGCTLFITGASRGIGKAIGVRAARDGANVVVAAKSDRPHPKLPGTIHTAAAEMEAAGYVEKWITYGNPYFAAKELTVLPGRTATIRDAGAYGFITVQGHGTIDKHWVETPALIRFGQLTQDEYFVSAGAAARGVTIHNPSTCDPLVMLKHFGPNRESPTLD